MCGPAGMTAGDCTCSAHAVGLVAQCVEYNRGSRVEDWQPLFQLTAQLAKPALLAKVFEASSSARRELSFAPETASAQPSSNLPAASPAGEPQTNGDAVALTEAEARLMPPSLSQQGLRLLQAVVAAHEQVLLPFPACVTLSVTLSASETQSHC